MKAVSSVPYISIYLLMIELFIVVKKRFKITLCGSRRGFSQILST